MLVGVIKRERFQAPVKYLGLEPGWGFARYQFALEGEGTLQYNPDNKIKGTHPKVGETGQAIIERREASGGFYDYIVLFFI